MARASTPTGLPLDTWAAILGISPWEFNNCNFPATKSAQCKDVIYQYGWQKDHLSREEIAEAIAAAEHMLAQELLYWPYPRYTVDEVQVAQNGQRGFYYPGWGYTARGMTKIVQANWKKIIQGGVLNRTHIGTITSNITKLDLDGDGIYETFQATITDADIADITNPYELALYFAEDSRLEEPLDETWRVRPLKITISDNTATFRGHRTLLVNPVVENRVVAAPLDSGLDENFVTKLECYRVYTDSTFTEDNPYQGVAIWKTYPNCTQDCTYEVKELCLSAHNNENGTLWASFGEICEHWFNNREPDRMQINYLSGLPLDRANGQIPREMAQIITYLSVSLLASEKCGCDRSNRILAKWREPIARFEDRNEAGATAFAANKTPFPMTTGGQYAWSRIKRLRDVEVVSL